MGLGEARIERDRAAEVLDRLGPALRQPVDVAELEVCLEVVGDELEHGLERAQRLVEATGHAGALAAFGQQVGPQLGRVIADGGRELEVVLRVVGIGLQEHLGELLQVRHQA